MKYAVHNLNTPACPIDDNGNHERGYKLPEPLFIADTMEEAEAWRIANPYQHPVS